MVKNRAETCLFFPYDDGVFKGDDVMIAISKKLDASTSSRWLGYIAFTVVLLFYFYENVLRIVPSLLANDLTVLFHLHARALADLLIVFYLIYAPMQLVVGMLFDRYPTGLLLTIALLLCSVGALLFANSAHFQTVLIARFLTGLGASFAFLSALHMTSRSFSSEYFPVTVGFVLAFGMLGSAFGEVFLNHLMVHEGWRLACFSLALVGVMLASLIMIALPSRQSGVVKSAFVGETVSFSLWRQHISCLVKKPQFWVNALIGAFLYMPILGFAMSWQIGFLQQVNAYHTGGAKHATMLVLLGWAVGAPVIGWLSLHISQQRLLLSLFATATTILLAAIIYVPGVSLTVMNGLLFCLGFCSSVQGVTFSTVRSLCDKRSMTSALALTSMIIMIASVSVYLLGVMLDWLWEGDLINHSPLYTVMNYQQAFLVLLAACVGAVLLTFFLRETAERR